MNVWKKSVLAIASFALTAGITAAKTVSVHADDWPQPAPVYMYRLYNPNSGEHFYTSAQKEKNNLVSLGWHDEGYGWIGCSKDPGDPVYRLYNANGGEHHYTMSTKERDALVKAGWKYEGIGWYSYDPAKDKTDGPTKGEPVYREYNPNAFSNNHNYTTDKAEHDHLISLGWKDEGVGWQAKFRNVLSYPKNVRYDAATKTVSWDHVKNATRYTISIYRDINGNGKFDASNDFSDDILTIDTIRDSEKTSYTLGTLGENPVPGTYFVQIECWNSTYDLGASSEDSVEHYLGSGYLYYDHYDTFVIK